MYDEGTNWVKSGEKIVYCFALRRIAATTWDRMITGSKHVFDDLEGKELVTNACLWSTSWASYPRLITTILVDLSGLSRLVPMCLPKIMK